MTATKTNSVPHLTPHSARTFYRHLMSTKCQKASLIKRSSHFKRYLKVHIFYQTVDCESLRLDHVISFLPLILPKNNFDAKTDTHHFYQQRVFQALLPIFPFFKPKTINPSVNLSSISNSLTTIKTHLPIPKIEQRAEEFILHFNENNLSIKEQGIQIIAIIEQKTSQLLSQISHPENMQICEKQLDIYSDESASLSAEMVEQTIQRKLALQSERVKRWRNLENLKSKIVQILHQTNSPSSSVL